MYRRGFLGRLAATAAAGVAGLTPLRLEGQPRPEPTTGADASFETWLNRINGKHKMIFDAPEPNSGMPVVWPRVWLNGNNENYGTKDADNSAVIVLRHAAIPIAMHDALWAKYKLGEVFNIKDGDAPAVRNVFAKVLPLPLPGTGIEALLDRCSGRLLQRRALGVQRRGRAEDGHGCGRGEGGLGRRAVTGCSGRAVRRAGGCARAGEGLRVLFRRMRKKVGAQHAAPLLPPPETPYEIV